MEVHEKGEKCPCSLLGEDSNPKHLLEDGYFELIDIVYSGGGNYIEHYIIRCSRCKKVYHVEEHMYHYMWWAWQVLQE